MSVLGGGLFVMSVIGALVCDQKPLYVTKAHVCDQNPLYVTKATVCDQGPCL